MEKSFLLYLAIAAVIATSYADHVTSATHKAETGATKKSNLFRGLAKAIAAFKKIKTNVSTIEEEAIPSNITTELEPLEPIAEISFLGLIGNLLESFQRFTRWLRWQQFFEPEMEEERHPFGFVGNFYNNLFGPSTRGFPWLESSSEGEPRKKSFNNFFENVGFDDTKWNSDEE
ncbi:uncharacterized protein LOC143451977 [Clavelina lepadiformis]|uniref:uncharacterized protein LOC143451977 n=1 Tax=Clavelina lepadiformis TaxID=159417 RepID=UPI0040438B63